MNAYSRVAFALLLSVGCSDVAADGTSGAGGSTSMAGAVGSVVGAGLGGTAGGGVGGAAWSAGVAGSAGASGSASGAGAGSSGASGAGGGGGGSAGGSGVITDPGMEGDGKIIIGKPFMDDPAQTVAAGTPRGQRVDFKMQSSDSKIYPLDGLGKPFSRDGAVYLPPNYVSGTEVPFMIAQDGVGNIKYVNIVPPALDNLIHDKKVPSMAYLFIDPGPDPGNDHTHSQRSIEYDTVSGLYTMFVETEVIPAAKKAVKDQTGLDLNLTSKPEGRGSLGGSSGGACAFTMGWFHPELYQKILSYSGSFQNLHATPDYPRGANEYVNDQDHLIASAPLKPLRVAIEVGTNDSASAVSVNEAMFSALTAKGNHVRYIRATDSGHVDQAVQRQTLAGNLIWLWRGYPIQ